MFEDIGVSIADLDNMIGTMRFWAFYCEKGGQGCYMTHTLRAAADVLERLKMLMEGNRDGVQ